MKGTARVTLFILFCVPCFEEPHWFRHGFSDLVRLQPQYVYHSGQFREHPWKKKMLRTLVLLYAVYLDFISE